MRYLIYNPNKDREPFDPSLRPNPHKAYVRTLGELLYLEWVERYSRDKWEVTQSREEQTVARRKLEYWRLRCDFTDQGLQDQVSQTKKDWASRRYSG